MKSIFWLDVVIGSSLIRSNLQTFDELLGEVSIVSRTELGAGKSIGMYYDRAEEVAPRPEIPAL